MHQSEPQPYCIETMLPFARSLSTSCSKQKLRNTEDKRSDFESTLWVVCVSSLSNFATVSLAHIYDAKISTTKILPALQPEKLAEAQQRNSHPQKRRRFQKSQHFSGNKLGS